MKLITCVSFLLILFSVNTFAQDIPSTILEGNTGAVNSVAFSSDGKTLANGSGDTKIRLWDAATGKHLRTIGETETIDRTHSHTLTGHTDRVYDLLFSPDGNIIASGSMDGTIRLWDAATGKHLRTLTGHTDWVYRVSFSPDGETLASGSKDGTIRLWDAATGKHLRTLTGHNMDSVHDVLFSPDGNTIISRGTGRNKNNFFNNVEFDLWDAATGEHLRTLTGDKDKVNRVLFSPDGNTLASGSRDGTIRLWDAATGEHLATLEGHTASVSNVAFSPDGNIIASGSKDETIRLWDVATGRSLHTLTGHKWSVSVLFSPDGKRLASIGGAIDGTIRLWDAATGEHLSTIKHWNVRDIAFSPDGQTLASGSGNGYIYLWDAATGEHLATLEGHTASVSPFNPDGNIIASRGGDGTIRLWDAATGKHLRTLTGYTGGLLFSPDGNTLAGGGGQNTIGLWDISDINTTGDQDVRHTEDVNSVSFSPDGQMLASGSSDRTILLWEVSTGSALRTFIGHTASVNSVSFSPDGQMLASGSSDGTVRLWNTATGAHKQTLNSEHTRVYSIAFSPDGNTLASGGIDGDYHLVGGIASTIRLWDVLTGAHKQTFTRDGEYVISVAFSPDGRTLASGTGESSTIRLLDVVTGSRLGNFTGQGSRVRSVAFSPDGEKLAADSYKTILIWKLPSTRVNLDPFPVVSPAIGEELTINVNIIAGENVGGYQVSLTFDPTTIRYVESANGDYLPPGAFFVPPVVTDNKVTLGATSLGGENSGDGTLATVTFEVVDVKESMILPNVIITDSEGGKFNHFAHGTRVEPSSILSSSMIVSLMPSSVLSPAVGEHLTFNIDITKGRNLKASALTLDFDQSALKYISSNPGNYFANGVGNGDGTLETVRFEVLDVKTSKVSVSGYLIAQNGFRYLPTFESAEVIVPLLGDVNRDGVVNILDLVRVASSFGQPVPEEGNPADVNEDGVVNVVDLVKVAGALGGEAAAPSAWRFDLAGTFTREQVQQWLSEARQFNLTDATGQRGILYLEQLLAVLTPKETALLPNYPNPFNPETWIPYQLSEAAEVSIAIYAVDGKLVRTLDLGYQSVGYYDSRSRAAYWDGRNALGENVASGVYFYTFTAGEFTATRKMLIRK